MKVVVAVDDTDCSVAVVEGVAARKWPAGTEFFLLTAIEPRSYAYGYVGPYMSDLDRGHEIDYVNYRRQRLGDRARQLQSALPHCYVQPRLVIGSVADTIAGEARACAADLLVVGSHICSELMHLGRQGVIDRIESKSCCPVQRVYGCSTIAARKQTWRWAPDLFSKRAPVAGEKTGWRR